MASIRFIYRRVAFFAILLWLFVFNVNAQTPSPRAAITPSPSPDITAPVVKITAPLAGTKIKGLIKLRADATDNVKMLGVQFKLNGVNHAAEERVLPYAVDWDTTKFKDGRYTVTALARDTANNQKLSEPVVITVENTPAPSAPPDTTTPVVSMTGPAHRSTVTGDVTLSANASDNVGVASVQFRVDGINVGSLDTSAPFSQVWDSTKFSDGVHSISAVAKDAAGNKKTSASWQVTVDNVALKYADLTCEGLQLDQWKRDANGWTVLPNAKEVGGRTIYVSASNVGKTPDLANEIYYATTAEEGMNLARASQPDQILFKRGESFLLTKTLDTKKLSGVSIDKPKVLGAYGTGERPSILVNGNLSPINTNGAINHLAIVDLKFENKVSGTKTGLRFIFSQPSKNILIENVMVRAFQDNIIFVPDHSGQVQNVMLRRSQILDSNPGADGSGNSSGIFSYYVDGLLIEDNVFDHNGYVSREPTDPARATIYNHNLYIGITNNCLIARNNIITRASSHGMQARPGGVVENNLLVRNPIGITWGAAEGGSIKNKKLNIHGATGRVINNAILESDDIVYKREGYEDKWLPRDGGMEIGNSQRVLVKGNIFAYHLRPSAGTGLEFRSDVGIGLHNARAEGNIFYDLREGFYLKGAAYGPLVIRNDGLNGTFIDDAIHADRMSDDGLYKIIDVDEAIEAQPKDPKTEMNGGDAFDPDGIKVVDSLSSGIVHPFGAPAVSVSDEDGLEIVGNYFQKINLEVLDITKYRRTNLFFKDNVYDCISTSPLRCAKINGVQMTMQDWLNTGGEDSPQMGIASFVDPTRSVGRYHQLQNPSEPATFEAFIEKVRNMSRDNWNPKYLATPILEYIRAGYKVP